MTELPPGWAAAKLDQVADWGSGGTPSRSRSDFYRGSIPWIKTGELGQGVIIDTEEKITPLALMNSSAKIFPKGSVAIAMYGATIGKVATLGIDAATNQACAVGIPNPRVTIKQYLLHYLASQKEAFVAKGQGGAQPNISQTIIKDWPIPLAPITEQQRIADKTDSLLAKVETCRQRLDRVQQILKKFGDAVLEAAVSGRLTEQWRVSRQRQLDGWSTFSVGQLVTQIEAGLNVQCEERPPGVGEKGLIKISAVTWGEFDEDESKTLPKRREVAESARIQAGDLLISRANTLELVGACVIVKKVARALYLSDKVLRLRTDDRYKPWLLISLRARTGRKQIEAFASGNQLSMRNLSQANLRSIEFPLPPEDELSEITHRVDELLGLADSLKRRNRHAASRLQKLTPSVLGKAFRGELVPQDPNDEPATKLLERVPSRLGPSRSGKHDTRDVASLGTAPSSRATKGKERAARRSRRPARVRA